MKHPYKAFLLGLACIFFSAFAHATTWTVTVVSNQFVNNPSTVNVGDTIVWIHGSGFHTTTSTTVPIGATPWDSPISSTNQTFEYVVTAAGQYFYVCQFHQASGMVATFTAEALGSPCTFTPLITPTDLMLCPNSSDTLFALPPGGIYQWYKEGVAIAGANEPFLVVLSEDALQEFTVEVTIDGCTDTSEAVTYDVMGFLLPFVMHDGDPGWIDPNTTLPNFCAGDTHILVFSYPNNVQWFNEGVAIPSANDDSLIVTESGIYTATGAPDGCPDFIMGSIDIQLVFNAPVEPTVAQVNDTLFVAPDGLLYQWFLNGNPILGATDAFFVPVQSGVYTVSATNDNGCSGTSAGFNFQSSAPCPFDAMVTPTDLVLCPVSSDTLFATPSGSAYQWFKGGVAIAGATNNYHVVNAFDDATFEFSVAVTVDGCTDTAENVVVEGILFLPPLVSQEGGVVDMNGITNVCAGDTVTLMLLTPYDTNIQWFDNGEVIPGANSSVFYATTGGSYTVSGAPAECPNYNVLMDEAIQVQVNIPMVPALTLSNDTIFASPDNAAPYTWYFNGDVVANETNSFLVAVGPGLYNAAMTDANECGGISAPIAFGLLDTCAEEPVISPNNLTLCPNTTDTLFVAPSNGAYQWYKDGLPISGALNSFILVNAFADAGAQFHVVAAFNGCLDTSAVITVTALSFDAPEVTVAGGWQDSVGTHHACTGETLTLTLSAAYNTGIQWFNGDPVPNANAQTLDITEGGTYTVVGAPAQCPDFIQTVSPGINVVYHTPVVPTITQSNDTLYAVPSNGSGYQWALNGNAVPGATNSWFVPQESGLYTVIYKDANQCDATSTGLQYVGVGDVIVDAISVYPNPVSETLLVGGLSQPTPYVLYDALGRTIETGLVTGSLSVQRLADGWYTLELLTGHQGSRRAFLKK